MSSCCDPITEKVQSTSGELVIALAGNPNSGKTTIFNALTGLRQKVANYPGVTVERKTGKCKLPDGKRALIIDLPGTYSLISRSPDEVVAMEVLRGLRADTPKPDLVIVVVDASNLQRNLYLVSQLVELGRPMVVALNMMDVAERRGINVAPAVLEAELGVPVIPVVGHRKQGIKELREAVARAKVAPLPDWPLPQAMKEELMLVGGGLAILDSSTSSTSPSAPGEGPVPPRAWICREEGSRRIDRYEALAERLLVGDHAPDIAGFAKSEPIASLLSSATGRMNQLGIDPMQADIEAHYRWIEKVASSSVATLEELAAMGNVAGQPDVLAYESSKALTVSDQVDSILVHKIWGLMIFAAIMGALFVSIFWLAKPMMDGIQNGVGALGDATVSRMPDGPIHDLIKDGIFAGVGAVVVFVPQIALLFMFLAILEDSGYLARAAFLMDRVLAKVGLHGKSFIPLLSSFACAIPGIMATRTIESRKDRLATILVAPFMSCSARLPVYTLLIGTFFASFGPLRQAGIMLSLYILGIVAAAATAFIFKRSFLKGPATSFILELPSYKIPQASQVARQVWVNSKEFLTKAGTTIFCLSVILWALMYYPRLPQERAGAIATNVQGHFANDYSRGEGTPFRNWLDRENIVVFEFGMRPTSEKAKAHAEYLKGLHERFVGDQAKEAVAAEQLRYSFAGRFGRVIEPVIKPLGYDWKMGVGLVGAFAAREVFISTMGIVYSVGEVEKGQTTPLAQAMRADTYANGKPVWTPLVAASLLIWFVLALQCMSTVAIVRRETGGWGWPIFMLVYMNGLAYVVCLIVYQTGTHTAR